VISEAAVEDRVRLLAPQFGGILWRNNSGAYKDETGRLIRYGLANESAKVNKRVKSADLIGLIPLVIRPEHVGKTLGLFTAIECKREGWKLKPRDDRAQAQLKYLEIVYDRGGFGAFCADAESFAAAVRLL